MTCTIWPIVREVTPTKKYYRYILLKSNQECATCPLETELPSNIEVCTNLNNEMTKYNTFNSYNSIGLKKKL
jgi:hypothetical protein